MMNPIRPSLTLALFMGLSLGIAARPGAASEQGNPVAGAHAVPSLPDSALGSSAAASSAAMGRAGSDGFSASLAQPELSRVRTTTVVEEYFAAPRPPAAQPAPSFDADAVLDFSNLPANAGSGAQAMPPSRGWRLLGGVGDFFGNILSRGSEAASRAPIRAGAAVAGAVIDQVGQHLNDPAMEARIKNLAGGLERNGGVLAAGLAKGASQAIDPLAKKALFYTAVGVAGVVGIGVTGHYLKKYINERMFQAELFTEQSSKGAFTWLGNLLGYGLYAGPRYSELVLAPQTMDELNQYFTASKYARANKFELPSLMLYGPTGTGKSEIAKRMAHELGFNFAFLAGSAFSQFSEEMALQKMKDLFKSAESSSRGTVIFIDEAETLLGSRTIAGRSEKAQQLTSLLLHLTEALSQRYTVIYATNRPDIMDDAMNRRVTFQVEVGNPDHEARRDIARFYFKHYIGKNAAFAVDASVGDELFAMIAEHTEGLSGAYIEEIWQRVRTLASMAHGQVNAPMVMNATLQVERKAQKKRSYISAPAAPAALVASEPA